MLHLSFSKKSLIGRVMCLFSLLALLLMLLIILDVFSLYWIKEADRTLYERALPASKAARELVMSSNELAENVQELEFVKTESQRKFIGRKLSINSANMLKTIRNLDDLNSNTEFKLEQKAKKIIVKLASLGEQVEKRIQLGAELQQQGKQLVLAARKSSVLLQAELAIIDTSILTKLSLAYPSITGDKTVESLLDGIIDSDFDTQARLNRGLKIINNVALMGLFFQSLIVNNDIFMNSEYDTKISTSVQYLASLQYLPDTIRDPERSVAFIHELETLMTLPTVIDFQKRYIVYEQLQKQQLNILTTALYSLNNMVDSAMLIQQAQAEKARTFYLQGIGWVKYGLLITGFLILFIIVFMSYQVIYKGVILKLKEVTHVLTQLSLGNTAIEFNAEGDPELLPVASAITAFKQKTMHNQALQCALKNKTVELTEHKETLEKTVESRTNELEKANVKLDLELKGHAIARDIAVQADKAKSLFLATMSHEIRTPLNGLLGTLTLLSYNEMPLEQRRLLSLSLYSGTLLQTVLNDILDFSKLEQGKLTNEVRPVKLSALLDDVIAIMSAGAELAGLTLTLQQRDLPLCVSIDGPKLRQVLLNLIGNGIKFTQAGHVTLHAQAKQGRLYIQVEDSGIGLSKNVKSTLFKAYTSQENQSATRGTGLGLTICKQLIELMDHQYDVMNNNNNDVIQVQSKEGEGSCFSFDLPITICTPIEQSPDVIIESAFLKSTTVTVPPKNILLVEDNLVNAKIAQGFLSHLGHRSKLLTTCEAVYAFYQPDTANSFDAIMLDIQLSDGSGIDLLQHILAVNSEICHSIEIAAFTAQTQTVERDNYKALGFSLVLDKPLNIDDLRTWLGVHIVNKVGYLPATADNIESSLLNMKQINEDIEYLGVDAVLDLVAIYADSSSSQIEMLGLKADNVVELLHGLRGSSASMGLPDLAALCLKIEKEVKLQGPYQAQSHQQLEHLWQNSMMALRKYISH